jgi:hypothetical protein
VSQMGEGMRSAIANLNDHKGLYDADLLAADFTRVRYVSIALDRAPDIVCSGVTQPRCGFDGQEIQDLADLHLTLDIISFSLIATDSGGAAVFSWRDNCDVSAGKFVDSLLALGSTEIPHALVRYAFSDFENVFFGPAWWEGLQDQDRTRLLRRFMDHVGPERIPDCGYLRDDGMRIVGWQVTRVDNKRA